MSFTKKWTLYKGTASLTSGTGWTNTPDAYQTLIAKVANQQPPADSYCFVMKEHLTQLAEFAMENNLCVILRETGPESVRLIFNKYPRRTAQIPDKLLVPRNYDGYSKSFESARSGLFNGSVPVENLNETLVSCTYNEASGLPSFDLSKKIETLPVSESFVIDTQTDKQRLVELFTLMAEAFKAAKVPNKGKGLVGSWATVKVVWVKESDRKEESFSVPVGVLRVGRPDEKGRVVCGWGSIDLAPRDAYTSDYQLQRIIPLSPPETSSPVPYDETAELGTHLHCLTQILNWERTEVTGVKRSIYQTRSVYDRYALLIQRAPHQVLQGPQEKITELLNSINKQIKKAAAAEKNQVTHVLQLDTNAQAPSETEAPYPLLFFAPNADASEIGIYLCVDRKDYYAINEHIWTQFRNAANKEIDTSFSRFQTSFQEARATVEGSVKDTNAEYTKADQPKTGGLGQLIRALRTATVKLTAELDLLYQIKELKKALAEYVCPKGFKHEIEEWQKKVLQQEVTFPPKPNDWSKWQDNIDRYETNFWALRDGIENARASGTAAIAFLIAKGIFTHKPGTQSVPSQQTLDDNLGLGLRFNLPAAINALDKSTGVISDDVFKDRGSKPLLVWHSGDYHLSVPVRVTSPHRVGPVDVHVSYKKGTGNDTQKPHCWFKLEIRNGVATLVLDTNGTGDKGLPRRLITNARYLPAGLTPIEFQREAVRVARKLAPTINCVAGF